MGAYFVRTSNLNDIDKHSCQLFRMGLKGKTTPTSLIKANMTWAVATILSMSLTFLSSSFSMANLSRVAASFSTFARLSSSVSTTNLSGLLATTFSSLRFLSNSLSSPRFNLLSVARRCFSCSTVSDDPSFPRLFFLFSFLLYLFLVLTSAFLSFVLQFLSSVCFKFLISK